MHICVVLLINSADRSLTQLLCRHTPRSAFRPFLSVLGKIVPNSEINLHLQLRRDSDSLPGTTYSYATLIRTKQSRRHVVSSRDVVRSIYRAPVHPCPYHLLGIYKAGRAQHAYVDVANLSGTLQKQCRRPSHAAFCQALSPNTRLEQLQLATTLIIIIREVRSYSRCV